jgi:hypothetical protein
VLWGTSVVWGTEIAGVDLNGESVLWGTSLPWGSSNTAGFSVIWGTDAAPMSVLWGTNTDASSAMSVLVNGDE